MKLAKTPCMHASRSRPPTELGRPRTRRRLQDPIVQQAPAEARLGEARERAQQPGRGARGLPHGAHQAAGVARRVPLCALPLVHEACGGGQACVFFAVEPASPGPVMPATNPEGCVGLTSDPGMPPSSRACTLGERHQWHGCRRRWESCTVAAGRAQQQHAADALRQVICSGQRVGAAPTAGTTHHSSLHVVSGQAPCMHALVVCSWPAPTAIFGVPPHSLVPGGLAAMECQDACRRESCGGGPGQVLQATST